MCVCVCEQGSGTTMAEGACSVCVARLACTKHNARACSVWRLRGARCVCGPVEQHLETATVPVGEVCEEVPELEVVQAHGAPCARGGGEGGPSGCGAGTVSMPGGPARDTTGRTRDTRHRETGRSAAHAQGHTSRYTDALMHTHPCTQAAEHAADGDRTP